MDELLSGGIIATLSGVIGFFISKKISSSNFDLYTEQAKAKAKAIELEAQNILTQATHQAKKIEDDAQKSYDETQQIAAKDVADKEQEIAQKRKDFEKYKKSELESISHKSAAVKSKLLNIDRAEKSLKQEELNYKKLSDDALHVVESSAGLTKQEAKDILLKKVEEQSRGDIAHLVRKLENEAKQRVKQDANFILAQATSRFAGEFATERLINMVHLSDDELKGRIIGKEGRNIKTLEMLLGVDVIIDETPNAIVVSSFNLYRRAIATKTLELLIEDGRIHPARIEEIYKKVCDEFEESILEEGEAIVFDLGINALHPELTKLIGRLRYRASYGQSALAHTLEVAHLAGLMAAEMGGDPRLAKRAGLLHDIGKALTHDVEGNHIDLGADVCRKYNEHEVVINAIYAHHGHQEMQSIECAAVCAADALSAARPGARREVLENFTKRISDIEEIASQKSGVKQAYAINAGREIRVIVNATLINDDESVLLSKEIAQEIEKNVQYPGEIKVNVIRESRSIEYAK